MLLLISIYCKPKNNS